MYLLGCEQHVLARPYSIQVGIPKCPGKTQRLLYLITITVEGVSRGSSHGWLQENLQAFDSRQSAVSDNDFRLGRKAEALHDSVQHLRPIVQVEIVNVIIPSFHTC